VRLVARALLLTLLAPPTDKFQDVSLSQWLALTPPAVVKAHLGVSDDTIAHFSKTKPVVVGGSRNVTKV
jgi:oxalate decarboxylase/phosphoglucose isomerase-like protein (cupin superfamily)